MKYAYIYETFIYVKYAYIYETFIYVILGDMHPVLICRTAYMCTYVKYIKSIIYGGVFFYRDFSVLSMGLCRLLYGYVLTSRERYGCLSKCTCRHELTCRDFLLLAGKGIWVSMRRRAQATTDSKCYQMYI